MLERAAAEKRVRTAGFEDRAGFELRRLRLVLRITANPALGYCSDLLAEIGASAVLAETTEIFGAEHLLVNGLGIVRQRKSCSALWISTSGICGSSAGASTIIPRLAIRPAD